jgi:uncharacterized protein YndB with AHSA1/START domain
MKLALIILGSIASLIAIVAIVGALLPRDHVVTLTARIPASPEAVWAVMTDPAKFPTWRGDVTKVELLAPAASGPSWREHSRHGAITMVVDLAEPPRKMIGRIADEGLPYGGKWIYEITPDGDSTSRVTITEAGSVYNPVFRFVSRFIMGHTASIDAYIRALGRHFGAEPTPSVVAGGSHGV